MGFLQRMCGAMAEHYTLEAAHQAEAEGATGPVVEEFRENAARIRARRSAVEQDDQPPV